MSERVPACKYCKHATVCDEWLDSDISDDVEGYLVCSYINVRVEDDEHCQHFKVNKKVYKEMRI